MDRWTDHQNFAAAGEQREEIASVHRAAIRSIQRDSNALNGCGAPPFEGTPQPIFYGFERANSATG